MTNLYFFTSSYPKDGIKCITIFTNSVKRAYVLAFNQFTKHKCKGVPKMLAI